MTQTILAWSIIVLGLVAALLWLRASVVRVSSDKHLAKLRARGELGPNESPFQITENGYDVLESMKASSVWNAWAAGVTALTVLLQAASNLLSRLG
ncbi:hypothetical protein [Caulobacter sp. Root487D2Y]|uniref:hypothetical protein n=1 Tax=Caulobacter sp. Root487D2Y TaxID=1736547 RepID=UPI0012E3C638|nr:hypothetical protein [Caulobacter sp. Root487D2Y]